MKVAVLSDIHGNMPALKTVIASIDAWKPDHVIVNGDIVNRGPLPLECWEIVAQRVAADGWQVTVGNHEQFTVAWETPRTDLSAAEYEMYVASKWTFDQLNVSQIGMMKQLPLSATLTAPDGTLLRATHASLRGTTDGVGPWTTDAELREKIAPAPAVFVTGHTHRAFTRTVDETLVVNAGAVGVPLDGDSRAAYAQIEWDGAWHAEIVRLDYDRDATQRDFDDSRFLENCGASGPLMYYEWKVATSHFPVWYKANWARVQSAEITAADSIKAYLDSLE